MPVEPDAVARPVLPVTLSELPPLDRYLEELRDIWTSRQLTNAGSKVLAFERGLREILDTPNLLSFCNGGLALIAGIRALELKGPVVTTPFTFPATTHCLRVNGLEPVFCDIDPDTLNLDPASAEAMMPPETSAVLAVHVFGTPCDVHGIDALASRRHLKVIYDGAHAFGTRLGGTSIAAWGDVQMFSFNATKLLTTGEGGCVVFRDPGLAENLVRLRRWGMIAEGDVTLAGYNGMMTEMQAALGLCNLEQFDAVWEARCRIRGRYVERLESIPGIRVITRDTPEVELAPAYFSILIDAERYGRTRDEVLAHLHSRSVLARRYFYPLTSQLPCYRDCRGAAPGATPVAERIVTQVLALPIYRDLGESGADLICDLIESFCPALP